MTTLHHIAKISSDSLLANVFENLSDGVYFLDRERTITYWSRGAARLTGYERSDVLGTRAWERLFDRNGQAALGVEAAHTYDGPCPVRRALEEGEMQEAQIFLRRRDGKKISVFSRLAPVRDAGGEIIGAVEIFSDNTPNMELLQRLHQLQNLAMQDPMTGLANRRMGEMTLQARLQEWNRFEWLFGVLFLDVDQFKSVNDRHGHPVGDETLQGLASRLRTNLRTFDTACRWGGDEFVVIVGHIKEPHVPLVADKVMRLLTQEPFETSSGPVRINLSIGATFAQKGDSATGIVERADAAMYQGKRLGGARVTMTPGVIA